MGAFTKDIETDDVDTILFHNLPPMIGAKTRKELAALGDINLKHIIDIIESDKKQLEGKRNDEFQGSVNDDDERNLEIVLQELREIEPSEDFPILSHYRTRKFSTHSHFPEPYFDETNRVIIYREMIGFEDCK